MSTAATNWVWESSTATGSSLLVLLAVADAANSQGGESCNGVAKIGQMARVSESTVHRALTELLASGDIVEVGTHPKYRTKVYGFPALMGGVNLTPSQSGGVSSEPAEGVTGGTLPKNYPTTTTDDLVGERTTVEGRRATIPSGWTPSTTTIAELKRDHPHVDLRRAHTRYVNHHRMRGTQAVDWDAGFRMWVQADDEQIVKDNPPDSVRFDDVTGMPINPRKLEQP